MKYSVPFYLITGVLMFPVITAVRPPVFFPSAKMYDTEMDLKPCLYPHTHATPQAQSYYLPLQACIRSARWCNHRTLNFLAFDPLAYHSCCQIYRLWVLSDRNKIMILFPVVGLFGYLGVSAIYIQLVFPIHFHQHVALDSLDRQMTPHSSHYLLKMGELDSQVGM